MNAYITSHMNEHAKQCLLSQSSMEATPNTSQNLGGFFKGKASPLALCFIKPTVFLPKHS